MAFPCACHVLYRAERSCDCSHPKQLTRHCSTDQARSPKPQHPPLRKPPALEQCYHINKLLQVTGLAESTMIAVRNTAHGTAAALRNSPALFCGTKSRDPRVAQQVLVPACSQAHVWRGRRRLVVERLLLVLAAAAAHLDPHLGLEVPPAPAAPASAVPSAAAAPCAPTCPPQHMCGAQPRGTESRCK